MSLFFPTVITGLTIQRLRGIREGELNGMTPLTILVGPNGSGKSAILDALLIGSSPNPADAVGRSILRRVSTTHGARWLLWKRGEHGSVRITTTQAGVEPTVTEVSEQPFGGGSPGVAVLRIESWPRSKERPDGGRTDVSEWSVTFDHSNEYKKQGSSRRARTSFVRMIDPAPGALQPALWSVYDDVLNAGHKHEARELLADLIEDFDDLTMSAEEDGKPALRLLYRSEAEPEASRGVPIGLAGDGIYVLTRVALELAACRSGVALLEEPEVHQYPRTLRRIAQAIVSAVARNVQVVVTTHSAELIRMLLGRAHDEGILERAAVIKVRLERGHLVSSNLDGRLAWETVDELGDDLR